jgi:hypothetical protein
VKHFFNLSLSFTSSAGVASSCLCVSSIFCLNYPKVCAFLPLFSSVCLDLVKKPRSVKNFLAFLLQLASSYDRIQSFIRSNSSKSTLTRFLGLFSSVSGSTIVIFGFLMF